MSAISWSNRIRDFLITKGINTVEATGIQVYVNRWTTLYADVKEDASLVFMLAAIARPIQEVAVGVYKSLGLSTSASDVNTWIKANRPDLVAVVTTLDDVIATDLNTTLLPSVPTVDNMAAVDVYGAMVANVLTQITRYMRHFATAIVYDANYNLVCRELPEVIP